MPMLANSSVNYVIRADQVFSANHRLDSSSEEQLIGQMLDNPDNKKAPESPKERVAGIRGLQSQSSVCSSVDMDCSLCRFEDPLHHQQFVQQLLDRHNTLRARHGAGPLVMNRNLTSYAKDWADIIARNDRLEHRSNSRHGENIFTMPLEVQNNETVLPNGSVPVDFWYQSGENYDYTEYNPSRKFYPFTQLVWLQSKFIGVAWAQSKSNRLYVVVNYSSAGNFPGQFVENVLPCNPQND